MNAISLRARSSGEILDGAFRLYRQDLGLYVLTAVLAGLPMAISMVLTVGGTDPAAFGWLGLASFFVAAVAYVIAWSALMHQMNERLVKIRFLRASRPAILAAPVLEAFPSSAASRSIRRFGDGSRSTAQAPKRIPLGRFEWARAFDLNRRRGSS